MHRLISVGRQRQGPGGAEYVTHTRQPQVRTRQTIGRMAEHKDIAARFGRRVKTLRDARRITQEEFAARSGLNRTYLSDVERGARNISLYNIEVIAKTLSISLSELMDGL